MNRQAGHSRLTKSGFGNTQVVAESTTQSEKKSKGESVKDESASHGFVAGVFRREVGGGWQGLPGRWRDNRSRPMQLSLSAAALRFSF